MTRDELDSRMRVVLNELRLCSHVPAASAGGGGQSASGKDASRGGRRPPGDLGATEYERAYGPPFSLQTHRSARTDRDRAQVLRDAESERDHLRGHEQRRRVQPETHEQLVQRMLVEARGLSPEAVATTSFRMLAREVRRYRREADLDTETGGSKHPQVGVGAAFLAQRAQRMRQSGMTVQAIADALGKHKTQILRWTSSNKEAA